MSSGLDIYCKLIKETKTSAGLKDHCGYFWVRGQYSKLDNGMAMLWSRDFYLFHIFLFLVNSLASATKSSRSSLLSLPFFRDLFLPFFSLLSWVGFQSESSSSVISSSARKTEPMSALSQNRLSQNWSQTCVTTSTRLPDPVLKNSHTTLVNRWKNSRTLMRSYSTIIHRNYS